MQVYISFFKSFGDLADSFLSRSTRVVKWSLSQPRLSKETPLCLSAVCCDVTPSNGFRPPGCSPGCPAGAGPFSRDCSYQLAASHHRCCRDVQRSPCHWIQHLRWQEKGRNFYQFVKWLACYQIKCLTDLFFLPRSWRCPPPQRAVPCSAPLRSSACRQLRSSLSAPCLLTGSPATLCQLRCPPSWLLSWQVRLSPPQLCQRFPAPR